MAQEVIITYETLFELLQREKEKPDLQKLDPTFFLDTISYIKDKKKILEAKSDSSFAKDEIKKTERQLENIYKILKEIYQRREKKITSLALDKSRTHSNLIDTASLLKEEMVFFDALTGIFDAYRDEILFSVLNEKIPFMHATENKKFADTESQEIHQKEEFRSALELKKSTKLIRFIQKVAKFIGPELEEFGPFDEENIANLPADIADVLINKAKAEEIKEE